MCSHQYHQLVQAEHSVYPVKYRDTWYLCPLGNPDIAQEVIFNSEFLLCKTRGCPQPDDVNSWSIDRGDAFLIKDILNGIYELEGRREEFFSGFIPVDELDELKQRGQITRADDPHPRYRVEKQRALALRTSCGETRQAGDFYPLMAEDRATRAVLEQLPTIAEVDGDRVKVIAQYGDADRMYEFYSYRIEDREAEERSTDRFFDVAHSVQVRLRGCRSGLDQEELYRARDAG